MISMKKQSLLAICLLVLIVALSRLLPHPAGFTPIAALGLFSGAYMHSRWSLAVPVLALLIGDLITAAYYNILIMSAVYISFAITALLGSTLLHTKRNPARIGLATFISALIFFIVSNASVWWVYYSHTVDGLLLCYINGLPYFGRGLLGDLFYTSLLFSTYGWCNYYYFNRPSKEHLYP